MNTLDTKWPETPAFFLSKVVSLELGTLGSIFRLETPSRVFTV